jgi:hypothetical protein
MKEFFAHGITAKLILLFQDTQLHHLAWPESPHTFIHSTPAVIEMLLDSVCVYWQFAYTPKPIIEDFHSLHVARDCILTVHALYKWHLAPTIHYMTNHAIIDAEIDGTAYTTLQEGVEHYNKEDKQESCVTLKGSHIATVRDRCSVGW